MNTKGRQKLDNEAVRGLVEAAEQLDNGTWQFTDDAGTKIIVDTEMGISYKEVDGQLLRCNIGKESSKQNGYVYTSMILSELHKNKPVTYGTHGLVAMLAHREQYDELVDSNKTPVPNHIDNCPWNNRADNLEWVTSNENKIHGRLIAALSRYDEGNTAELPERVFTQIKHNLSNEDYVTLRVPFSCADIREFERYIIKTGQAKNLNKFFGLTKEHDTIPYRLALHFLWWWEARTGKACCWGRPVNQSTAYTIADREAYITNITLEKDLLSNEKKNNTEVA